MHYPMRSIQKGCWKLIVNISYYSPFPLDADAYNSLLRFYSDEPKEKRDDLPENKVENTYDKLTKCNLRYGKRTVKDYLIRPKFELYNLSKGHPRTPFFCLQPARPLPGSLYRTVPDQSTGPRLRCGIGKDPQSGPAGVHQDRSDMRHRPHHSGSGGHHPEGNPRLQPHLHKRQPASTPRFCHRNPLPGSHP